MNILVTGGAGFIGSHICEALIKLEHTVVSLDNYDPFYDPDIKKENLAALRSHELFTELAGDIRNKQEIFTALTDYRIDTVIHLAALAGVRPSIERAAEYFAVNVTGTVNVIEACRECSISKLIIASSSSVYGNAKNIPFSEKEPVTEPISPYAASKRSMEIIAYTYHHLYKLDIALLRLFTVYGPRQRPDLAIHKFTRLISRGEPIPMFGDGSTQRDYTYIDDIKDGIVKTLAWVREGDGSRFDIFNLGESRTISLTGMIATIGQYLGKTPVIDRQPMQPGDVLITYADISKARDILGYNPTTEFGDGVEKFIEWYRQEIHT